MKISRAGSAKTSWATQENFTGKVRVEACFSTDEPARAKGNYVTFEPRARTNWHSHELGQTIIIVHGSGRVQREGGSVKVVNVGDVVFFEPDEKHWHGGGLESAMMHLTVSEMKNGKSVDWYRPVTDEQYEAS